MNSVPSTSNPRVRKSAIAKLILTKPKNIATSPKRQPSTDPNRLNSAQIATRSSIVVTNWPATIIAMLPGYCICALTLADM
jgi:hypothetical protein